MFYGRYLQEGLTGRVSRNKVRLLFGARQTGKTALLRRLLSESDTRFFNLQESQQRRQFEVEPAAFGREVRALPRSIRNVVVDEIQKVPALLDEVQALYDSSPARWQFFLTGSSARRLRTQSANLLPGRSHSYHLYPVCGWEVARAREAARQIPPPAGAPRGAGAVARRAQARPPQFPPQPLTRVLTFGSLPGIRAESQATARATLEAYVNHYLEEEIRREALVREMGPFSVFLRLAASEAGQQVNLAKLSQESGVPAATLKNYYQVLVDTFVGYWLPAYARRSRKRLLTTPRFYLLDTGVRNAAAESSLEPRLDGARGGALLEHWVAQELIARAGYFGRTHRVSFWRTTYGVEVDFVWETPSEDVPIEVKWTSRPRPDDARHLETFLDEYPGRARRGLLVCRCERPQQLTQRVLAIPWEEL
jgi:predicted AAA+ superfamily ATPase